MYLLSVLDFIIELVFVYIDYVLFFFFKQKTAYEMRISDWSSDVCSSDLLTDDLNDILQPFHWEAWKAALFSDHPDGWPDDDEQDAICQRVDSMAVGEHYQAWSEEVQEKIVSLFSHRLNSTAELRAKLEDANRSEERRVGKEWVARVNLGGRLIIKKKNKQELNN